MAPKKRNEEQGAINGTFKNRGSVSTTHYPRPKGHGLPPKTNERVNL